MRRSNPVALRSSSPDSRDSTIMVKYLVLKFCGKKFSSKYWAHCRCLFIFFSILNNPIFQVIGRKASEVAEMAVKVPTASYSFICWFLMIGLLEWLIDWRFSVSVYGIMLKLYDFYIFFSCFLLLKGLVLGIIIAEFFSEPGSGFTWSCWNRIQTWTKKHGI